MNWNSIVYRVIAIGILVSLISCATRNQVSNYPNPENNPESSLMLEGDWVPEDTHQINFNDLPRLKTEHIVISNVGESELSQRKFGSERFGGGEKGENQHNYLTHYDDKFWAMWSDGPAIEARVGTVVKYSTSYDGLVWSEPQWITPYPPNSTPESPHYNTRTDQGFRYMSRGFWVRDNELLALASLDEAVGFFGKSLELVAFRWNDNKGEWEEKGQVFDNTINNFPPKMLPTGEWMMSRRDSERDVYMIIGGVQDFDQWQSIPVTNYRDDELAAEEPQWWTLPDGNLVALFRDNGGSGYLFRSFSTDNGRTWTRPVKTNFPDSRSKFFGMKLSDGRYALVSNPDPGGKRDPLTLAISDDGLVFNKMYYIVGGRWVDYPHMMEHNGYLYIAHSGGKQSVEIQRISISDLK